MNWALKILSFAAITIIGYGCTGPAIHRIVKLEPNLYLLEVDALHTIPEWYKQAEITCGDYSVKVKDIGDKKLGDNGWNVKGTFSCGKDIRLQ